LCFEDLIDGDHAAASAPPMFRWPSACFRDGWGRRLMDARLKNRLRPPLMFAFREAHREKDAKTPLDLRSESGERILAGRRAAPRAAITEQKLRQEIAIDLEALVNTVNLGSSIDLSRHEQVARSVLNHGFPDITHRSIDEYRVNAIKDELADVLVAYEPRLIKRSVAVERDESLDAAELKIRFVVRADLNCQPLNIPIQFVADVELDTGKIAIKNR
jgi:type VI secretion system protein ImpF